MIIKNHTSAILHLTRRWFVPDRSEGQQQELRKLWYVDVAPSVEYAFWKLVFVLSACPFELDPEWSGHPKMQTKGHESTTHPTSSTNFPRCSAFHHGHRHKVEGQLHGSQVPRARGPPGRHGLAQQRVVTGSGGWLKIASGLTWFNYMLFIVTSYI